MPLLSENAPLVEWTWSDVAGDRWQVACVTSYDGGGRTREYIVFTDKFHNTHNVYKYHHDLRGRANPLEHKYSSIAVNQSGAARFIAGPRNNEILAWMPVDGGQVVRYWFHWETGQFQRRDSSGLSGGTADMQFCRLGIRPGGPHSQHLQPYILFHPSSGRIRWWRNFPLAGEVTHTWGSIRTGHQLVPLHKRMLTWEPESGDYRLWNVNLHHDPLNPLISRGFFETIFEPDQLIPIGLDRLLVWTPGATAGRFRIFSLNF